MPRLIVMTTTVTLAKAVQFNNAGVACFRSEPKKAWELFKGALEVKLAMERTSMNSSRQAPATPALFEQLSAENAYVKRAQTILEEGNDDDAMDLDPNNVGDSNVVTLEEVEASRILVSSTLCQQFGKELGNIFYTPFLFTKPFLIPDQDAISPSEMARTTSAIVIFNLALVEHLFNRSSNQAVSLYELATSLLVGQTVDQLGLALINNIGVWCYENDDLDAAQRCMDHLSRIMRSCHHLVSDADQAAILRNICCLLTPSGSTSPAA